MIILIAMSMSKVYMKLDIRLIKIGFNLLLTIQHFLHLRALLNSQYLLIRAAKYYFVQSKSTYIN